ncbi:TIGR03986 family CRISPR-associated RAMP protein [Clostridium botulinum]|uniref:TIGR03986 family type III CRISPR-associated RAMP protein n=1 Tax=Clostridium botulinum TaxID=1491 RepID=UPI0005863B2A|nr:TIGR03986 family CRISPR-associated RAMP protein [Clostridium botulinum]AJD25626.1 RAMP superfamily protein [Clostridium botulinum CDC_297]MBY6891029.1 TIGR03986 family CRISPR-associated RAMP protein [Clostridium botulinum]MBY6894605.1 TIGR03986 family CRISPR-associated RAMP protein [Clostridium botulinum]MBY6901503.1 TIGR03986 family CRISPR-associated RAMP protein [Clostridium botulinum]UOJ20808.1 TIGR03986 family CRISPR-associated RAMP protein [Clostridium botulinum]
MAHNNQNKERYARAPYNFIPFPKKIFYRHTILPEYEDKKGKGITVLPMHNVFEKGLKTGYIDYLINVETPLFISDGEKESDFFKVNGEYRIPGSTIRGKVRSNAEILSCSYPEFIENKKLWFRGAFSKDVLKDMYKKVVLPDEAGQISDYVKAGYLTRKVDKWFITPAKQVNNKFFKEIHESKLRSPDIGMDKDVKSNIFMYEDVNKKSGEKLWGLFRNKKNEKKGINKNIKEKRKELSTKYDYNLKQQIKELENEIKNIDAELRTLLRNNERKGFKPYYYEASYFFKDNNEIVIKKVSKSLKDKKHGILMNSSRLNCKQNHYLIFEKDTEKGERSITKELINQYSTSVQYRQKKEVVENFEISNEDKFGNGKEKPIFYITDKKENIIAFGFTPYLKIPYKKSVQDGIKIKEYNAKESEKGKIDYAKGIFGFTNFKLKEKKNSISYKGRLSFTNAKPVSNEIKQVEKPILKHLMNPKISSFQLYLKQGENNPKKLKTYSSDDFELRGEKFYWLRNEHDSNDDYEKEFQQYEDKQRRLEPMKNQYVKLYPVDKGEKFKGRIYFENLYEDELGLLLMSIKPRECARENLGQGKPYGYGKVNFQIEDIVEIDPKKRFVSLNPSSSEKSILANIVEYIDKFIDYMKRQNINVDFKKENMYKCFAQSKIQEKEIWDREFNYMGIKEFTNRNILKPMESYIHDKKISKDEVAVTKEESQVNLDTIEKMLSSKYKTTRKN